MGIEIVTPIQFNVPTSFWFTLGQGRLVDATQTSSAVLALVQSPEGDLRVWESRFDGDIDGFSDVAPPEPIHGPKITTLDERVWLSSAQRAELRPLGPSHADFGTVIDRFLNRTFRAGRRGKGKLQGTLSRVLRKSSGESWIPMPRISLRRTGASNFPLRLGLA